MSVSKESEELWSLDPGGDEEQEAREEATALQMRRAGKRWKQIGLALHISLQGAQAVYDRALRRERGAARASALGSGGAVAAHRPPGDAAFRLVEPWAGRPRARRR